VYRNCVYCAGDLGSNEIIEEFPVGRRLAFDGARGRLWVVCRRCERWNLSPLEIRWEAIEECERRFRETRLRVSTENIGLARLSEGLELVRVGAPKRPEFAAWRYGDQFGRRRRRFMTRAAIGVGVGAGLVTGSSLLLGGAFAMLPINLIQLINQMRPPVLRVTAEDGTIVSLRTQHLGRIRLRPTAEVAEGWHLQVPHRKGTTILTGREAVHALGLALPTLNLAGAASPDLRTAIQQLEAAGDPESYFRQAEHQARKVGWGYASIGQLPKPIRLALEMAAHEDHERAAVEGELALLEQAWREAEEIAKIADDLTLPDRVRAALARLRWAEEERQA
jgi:hypothetical protein